MSSGHFDGFSKLEVPQLAFVLPCPRSATRGKSQPPPSRICQRQCCTCTTPSFPMPAQTRLAVALGWGTERDVAPGERIRGDRAGSRSGLAQPPTAEQIGSRLALKPGPDAAAAAGWVPDSLSPRTSSRRWHCWGDVAVAGAAPVG